MDNNHLFANTQSMYNDDGSGYEIVDPGAADALFTQGGFVSGPDHTWTFHGAPVTLDLTWADDDPWSEAVGPLVASQLVGAGLDVDATPVPMSDLMGTVLPGATFDLAIVPMGASAYPSALDGAFSPTAAAASPGLAQDWSGFDDPEVDSLMTQAAAQLSVSQAGALYQQIDDILWQEMPTLPLLAEPSLMAYSVSLLYVNNDPGGLGVLWDDVDWRPLVATPPVRAKTQSG
jgi:peptide/nickel transport system substrate-binding protein